MMSMKPADSPRNRLRRPLISPDFSEPSNTHAMPSAKGDTKMGKETNTDSVRRNGTSVRPRIQANVTPSDTESRLTRKPSQSELPKACQYVFVLKICLILSKVS